MNKSKEFWDRASKNYDKTEERFEYIHSKSRENTKKHLNDSDIVLDVVLVQHPVKSPIG